MKWNEYSQGVFYTKALGHGSWESLNSHSFQVSRVLTLGIDEGRFWTAAHNIFIGWKIYVRSYMASVNDIAGIVGSFFEDGSWRLASWKFQWEFEFAPRSCALQKTLGYSPWASLWSLPKSEVPWRDKLDKQQIICNKLRWDLTYVIGYILRPVHMGSQVPLMSTRLNMEAKC